MKTNYIILILFIFNLNIQAQMNIKSINPSEYFDFWIGSWDLSWKSGENHIGTGENTISKTLKNQVIEENFKVIDDPNMLDFKGKSWSVYNKTKGNWYQTWVDNQGSYLDFIGEIDGENRIFKREVLKPDGSKILQRMIFYNIQKNSFTWDWENSSDSGRTWNLQWRINYKRKEIN